VNEAKLLGGLVGPENRRRRSSSLRRLGWRLERRHIIGLHGAAPRSSTTGRRAPHAVGEQLGEDFGWLDPSSDGGRHESGVAHGRARRRYEQRHVRKEGVSCGVSLAHLWKDKAQAGADARGVRKGGPRSATRWQFGGNDRPSARCGRCGGLTRALERVDGGLGPFWAVAQ
jgi:hypothetical protein